MGRPLLFSLGVSLLVACSSDPPSVIDIDSGTRDAGHGSDDPGAQVADVAPADAARSDTATDASADAGRACLTADDCDDAIACTDDVCDRTNGALHPRRERHAMLRTQLLRAGRRLRARTAMRDRRREPLGLRLATRYRRQPRDDGGADAHAPRGHHRGGFQRARASRLRGGGALPRLGAASLERERLRRL